MKRSLCLPIQQQSFLTTEDWDSFAAAQGIEPDFFLGPAPKRVEQPLTAFVITGNGEICAIAVLFMKTHEVGLWVAPSRRRQGYGRQVLSRLVAQNTKHLYATVCHDNPHAGAMEFLLAEFGFASAGNVFGHRVWRVLPHRP